VGAAAQATATAPGSTSGAATAEAAPLKKKTTTAAQKAREQKSQQRRSRGLDRLMVEFQPDAVEMEYRKVAGGLRWTLYAVILLLVAAVGWAWWAKVDRIVMADGKLISPESIVIQPPTTSPIRDFNVTFGQIVKSGYVLVTLDPTFSDADVSKLVAQENGLGAQLARLDAEQKGLEQFDIFGHEEDPVWINERVLFIDRMLEWNAKQLKYEADKRKLEATRNKHKADELELENRKALLEKKLKSIQRLEEERHAPETELIDSEINYKYAVSQLTNAKNSILEADADIDALEKGFDAEKSSQRTRVSAELAKIRQDYNVVLEDLNKARRAKELVTIPVPEHPRYKEFVVVEVAERNVGSVVSPGDTLVRLIPVDVVPELECRVDAKDIAKVRETEDGKSREVRIKLAAFPYVKHGTLKGRVRAISEDAFHDNQQPQSLPYYKVRIEITSIDLEDVPADTRLLVPGMAGSAEIKVGTRRVIDYFLDPLFQNLDSSIREPE
jgi:hemolysin D